MREAEEAASLSDFRPSRICYQGIAGMAAATTGSFAEDPLAEQRVEVRDQEKICSSLRSGTQPYRTALRARGPLDRVQRFLSPGAEACVPSRAGETGLRAQRARLEAARTQRRKHLTQVRAYQGVLEVCADCRGTN